VHTAQDSDQSGLARAILADQRMNFAEIERKIDIVERPGGAELLAQGRDADGGWRH
jgi:hypothetical protein